MIKPNLNLLNYYIYCLQFFRFVVVAGAQCCGAGAGTFWSEPEPVWSSGSGSILDNKKKEILNDIFFVRFNID